MVLLSLLMLACMPIPLTRAHALRPRRASLLMPILPALTPHRPLRAGPGLGPANPRHDEGVRLITAGLGLRGQPRRFESRLSKAGVPRALAAPLIGVPGSNPGEAYVLFDACVAF